MIIHHAKALGIGAAVLFSIAIAPAQAQTIPSNVARPLNAAANVLSGGQVATPAYETPYGYATASPSGYPAAGMPHQPAAPAAPSYYAPGYGGWTAAQPGYAPARSTYPAYTAAQPGYTTRYYQSGYSGYVQPRAMQYSYPQATRANPVANAVRSIVRPQRYAYPTYAAPGYAPTYVAPR